MMRLAATAAAVLASLSLAAEEVQLPIDAALVEDDQCSAGDEQCALNALQLRGKAITGAAAAATAADAEKSASEEEQQEQTSLSCSGNPSTQYTLNWEARGKNFFDKFTFMNVDETHGAQVYVSKEEALRDGLISADDNRVIIRTGGVVAPYKRKSINLHSNNAWHPGQSMLVAMKYKHVPYGPGVWPGFWAMNSDVVWPAGGELDILEFANDEANKVSFHTSKNCFLDTRKIRNCMRGGLSDSGPSNCNTNYFQNLFGCRPPQIRKTGQQYANTPGVIASEWTPEHVKVFHIPEGEIPPDMESGSPKPETWDKWIIAYLPFNAAGCQNLAQPQELVLTLALCGDWAGGAWEKCSSCQQTGFSARTGRCHSDIWTPAVDCCTQYITSSASEAALKQRAYFDISWVRTWTPSTVASPKLTSGTYRRNGVPLK